MHDVMVTFISPGMVHSQFAASAISMAAATDRIGGVVHAGGVPRIKNLNDLSMTLLNSEFEWGFQVDTDMDFASDTLDRLLATAEATDHRIVSGVYFGLDNEPVFNVGRDKDNMLLKPNMESYADHDAAEVNETGEGCLLIHRTIFEEIHQAGLDGLGYPFWDDFGLEDGTRTYEERYFFDRVWEVCGEKPIVDLHVRPGHMKGYTITWESVWEDKHG